MSRRRDPLERVSADFEGDLLGICLAVVTVARVDAQRGDPQARSWLAELGAPLYAEPSRPRPRPWPPWVPAVLAQLEAGASVSRAAAAAGVTPPSVYQLAKRHDAFAAAVAAARDRAA